MIIAEIDQSLEALVRQRLPLPQEYGDVSFDPPSAAWSAQLARVTVNLFLFGTGRSPQPPRPAADRVLDGRQQRRPPVPMLQMHYLVTAWAGTVRDEHQLIGDLLTLLLNQQSLPPELLPKGLIAPIQLAVAHHDNTRAKDVWSTVGGTIRPSFEIVLTTPADEPAWADLAPPVERIARLVAPVPRSGG